MFLSKCEMHDSIKSNLSQNKKLADYFNGLGIKTPLNKIPLLAPPLFYCKV